MTSQAYHEALISAAKTMVRVQNPRSLLKMIARFIVQQVGLTHASIVIHEAKRNRYIFVDSKGSERIPTKLIRLDRNNPLIEWFLEKDPKGKGKKSFLLYSELLKWVNANHANGRYKEDQKAHLVELKNIMATLKSSLCVPGFYKGELLGVLILGEKIDHESFTPDEISFFQALANDASIALKAANLRENLLQQNLELELKQKELKEKLHEIELMRTREQATYHQIVLSLAREVYAKDPYTSGHLAHVEKLGIMTAQEMSYDLKDERKRNTLTAALHLHDVGKIGIPDAILKKKGPLTDEEWKVMRQHPIRGAKILEPLTEFRDVGKIVLHHHENYDGTGYPYGLKGEDIPLESRIISVVDAFHAIVSTRCYREGRPVEVAFSELEKGAGTQFDADVVRAFIRAYQKAEGKQSTGKRSIEQIA